ncbi:MAG: hypothetical protein OXL68_05910 [Paracoccaceae bacterium]|nr:hypothetical protein [Paracoccaceae bacterium]
MKKKIQTKTAVTTAMEIRMNSDRNSDVSRYAIRKLAIASVCLPLCVFLLGLIMYVLFLMSAMREMYTHMLLVSATLLPIGGAISGHVAVRKIDEGPESADNYRRLAVGGTIISYIFALIFVSLWVRIVAATIFDLRIHFH